MITCRDYWRVMNGGYLDNPHFLFVRCQVSVVKDNVVLND
jgi:hypothetical protein